MFQEPTFTLFETCGHHTRPIGEAKGFDEARQRCMGELINRDDADAVRAFDEAGNCFVNFERIAGGEIADFSMPMCSPAARAAVRR